MSAHDPPEKPRSKLPPRAESAPDLRMREPDLKEDGVSAEANDEKSRQESVFSARSGIQDLIKVNSPEGESPEAPVAPDENADAPLAPKPGRPARKGKVKTKKNGKLAKSQRQLDRARRRQMNYLQKRREKKKMRVFYGRIRAIFKLFFAVLWGILLWEMVHSTLWNFNPPTYKLETSRSVQAAQLKGLVQKWAGKPLYAVDTGKLADQIESRFDLVDRAVVRRQLFPASLTIQLFEKHPWAQLYAPDAYDAFQKKAEERAKQAAAKSTNASEPGSVKAEAPMLLKPYAVATGDALISMGPYRYDPTLFAETEKVLIAPKTKVSLDYLRRLRELAWQARQIPGFHLEVVDIRNPQRILFRFKEVPVMMGALNNSATERLSRLAPLKGKVQEYRDVIESVDLQWEEQVTFHKRPNAQLKKPRTEPIQG